MNEYDISAAFEEIEGELIASMARNFRGHRDWELAEGFDWPMWQAEMLKGMERYRQETRTAMEGRSAGIDRRIDQLLETTFLDAAAEQERMILQAIRRGAKIPRPPGAGEDPDAFFRTNARKLDALREATKNDLHTAETATLRMAEDVYRKTIFNAQVYANTGAGTLWQAVDMATRHFLAAGLGAVRYRDGRQVNAASYAEMAIRTANKRAYLTGEGAKRQEWGVALVIVTRRGTGCPYCVKWQGRVYVDDVWSGGRPDGRHPLLSAAIAGGLYHPNCKDSHTTFFPGVNTEPGSMTAGQQRQMVENFDLQQKQRYHERQVRKYKRLEMGSLDPANKEKYAARRQEWQTRTRELVAAHPDVLRREYDREKVRVTGQAAPRESDLGDKVRRAVKGAKVHRKVVGFDGLPKDYREAFRAGLAKAAPEAKEVLRREYRKADYIVSEGHKSYYRRTKDMVEIGQDASPSTLAHELFHRLDEGHKVSKTLEAGLTQDYVALNMMSGGDIKGYLSHHWPEAFAPDMVSLTGEAILQEKYRGIADILNGVSGGDIDLGYYHRKDYWAMPGALEAEAWAQFGRIQYENDPEVLEMLSAIFPNLEKGAMLALKGLI